MSRAPSKPKTIVSDLGLFYAAAIWGSTFFIVKDALADIDPVVLVGYRFILAGGLMLAWLKATGRPVLRDLSKGLWLSIILLFLYIPQTIGLEYTTASNSGFITGLFVAFVPMFLPLITKQRPTRIDIAACLVSLSGLWVLTGGLHDVNFGDMITLLAAMTYALHVLYAGRYMKAGVDPYAISCQQFLLVGILSLLLGVLTKRPFEVATANTWGVVVFLALFPTLSAFVIQMMVQRITAPVKVSLIFALEPVFAAVFAWTIGGEQLVVYRVSGGALIFAALVIASFSRPKPTTDG
ncbi:MAG: DMT family transporter [bacterium]